MLTLRRRRVTSRAAPQPMEEEEEPELDRFLDLSLLCEDLQVG